MNLIKVWISWVLLANGMYVELGNFKL